MSIALVCDNRSWRDRTMPWQAIGRGLNRRGHRWQQVVPVGGDLLADTPTAAILWNGCKGASAAAARWLAERNVPVLVCERGFFRRDRYTQIDPAGFNHTASWAGEVTGPPPAGAERRLFKVLSRHPVEVRPRRRGYVLLLGQVSHDAQLAGAEIRHPRALVDAVRAAGPAGVEIVYRPHPMGGWHPPPAGGVRVVAGTLADALRGARLAVTVNSNAAHEATAAGVPVLGFGPSLALRAGVARRASLATLADDLNEMCAGWHPPAGRGAALLAHLAARQYNHAEWAAGDVLAGHLALLGIPSPAAPADWGVVR
jgi:hypothetical protein